MLVDAGLFMHNGRLGILMEKASGRSLYQVCAMGRQDAVERLCRNPLLHRDMSRLQVLDVLAATQGLCSRTETKRLSERVDQLQEHVRKLQQAGKTVTDWSSGKAGNGTSVLDILAADPYHPYSQRFIADAARLQGDANQG